MKRQILFLACLIFGLALIGWAWLLPSYFRAVDSQVLAQAGEDTPSLVTEGLRLVNLEKIGPAKMLLLVAQRVDLPVKETLDQAVTAYGAAHPEVLPLGKSDPLLGQLLQLDATGQPEGSQPIFDLLLPQEIRARTLGVLQNSRRPGVQEILKTRSLTNTVEFPPALSSSGQPLEAAILLTALLFQGDHVAPSLRDAVDAVAAAANRGQDVRPLEVFYLDLLSLGKRLNWAQLTDFLARVGDLATLSNLAKVLRERETELPVLFSAVHLSDSPASLARYVLRFGDSSIDDLRFSLMKGKGAVRELLERQKPIHHARLRETVLLSVPISPVFTPFVKITRRAPVLSLVFKCDLLLIGAFLLGLAMNYVAPVPPGEEPQQKRLISTPQMVFALCFLGMAVLLTEPFLLQAHPKTRSPLRWQFPMVGGGVRQTMTKQAKPMIDQYSLLTLLAFVIIQAAIYSFCRHKLAEIARQAIPSKLKLRLLENEEHLFDAGLYIGFVGTVLSFIFVSLGVVKPSLMAAYSSTCFGIIFVSILKIFHVRPLRRRLIMQGEMEAEIQVA
jgi:hypothetical protein